MHVPTHIMSGWCGANLFRFSPTERLLCMIAATVPDLDGLSRIFGENAYWDWHHKLTHNLLSALVVAAVAAVFARRRIACALVCFGLFHLHLAMDLVGSGPGWPIHYLWPYDSMGIESRHVWELYSWQNIAAAGALLAWTILIAAFARRTPLEKLMPALDRQLVDLLPRRSR